MCVKRKNQRPRLYFGHPINVYNTPLENQLLAIIAKKFPQWEIENPGQKHHQKNVKKWKEKTGNAMNYFYEKVLPECQGGIFLPFRDGKWGAGIVNEAKELVKRKCPVWQITFEGSITTIKNLSKIKVLSVEETRKRIMYQDGRIRPY